MDEIKFKITLKVNDLYYFMMHHYYSKPAGIIGLVLSLVHLYCWLPDGMWQMQLPRCFILSLQCCLPLLIHWCWGQRQRHRSRGTNLWAAVWNIFCQIEHLSVCLGEEKADIEWNQIIKVKDNGRELVVIWPQLVLISGRRTSWGCSMTLWQLS